MQEPPFSGAPPNSILRDELRLGERSVPLELVRNHRARRYVLRLTSNGTARVTVPRRGSWRGARAFAEQQTGWLARQLARLEARPAPERRWLGGGTILFRGDRVGLLIEDAGSCALVRFADQTLRTVPATVDVRAAVERHLSRIARQELPPRALEFARREGLQVARISIRNQRSRWGSCSPRGSISLNWRLVQMPFDVRDYVIWHELMHLREMNHSPRFWRHVAAVCPDYRAARDWIRKHGESLR